MLISHESPLCLLEKSKSYNDYQYCLVHLCEKYPEYYKHFKQCVEEGIEVLLDNSIFELGVAFDSDEYAKVIVDLKPTHYIVPDALEDMEQTISLYKHFVRNYPNLPGNKIGVIQGKTFQELVECYNFMKYNCDYIAISFDYSYYQTTGLGNSKLERMCDGRARLIDSLRREKVWDDNKPHHLLGCSLPKEFSGYGTLIRSVDTSNPIMCGIKGMRYAKGIGVSQKPIGLLADNMEINIPKDMEDAIFDNIKEFKALAVAPLWDY
jgi:hypothetical protein